MITQKTYRKYKYGGSMNLSLENTSRFITFVAIGNEIFDFVTREKEIQDALEAHPHFHITYWLVDTKEIEEEIQAPAPIILNEELIIADNLAVEYSEVKDICDTKAAKAYFKEKGIKYWMGAKEEEVKEVAKKNNINFIDWK